MIYEFTVYHNIHVHVAGNFKLAIEIFNLASFNLD